MSTLYAPVDTLWSRIAARNARNRQRDRALRAALTADPTPLWRP